MLPSSHSVLIADAADFLEMHGASGFSDTAAEVCAPVFPKSDAGMQTVLAGAFADFMGASMRLEQSYRALQEEVSILRQELSTRNAALEQSRIQNRRMRLDLERIVESMPCGVIVVQKDGTIALINREGLRLLDAEGTRKPNSISALGALLGLERLDWAQLRGASDFVTEVHKTVGNQERWIEVRNHLHVDDEQAHRQILILRDVTGRKLAEGKREEGRRAMALAEVSADIAHEIRNPLGSLELIADLIETDEMERGIWISNLRAGIRSLSATVNNVLMMQQGSLRLVGMDLAETLESALSFARPLAEQAEVRLEWNRAVEEFPIRGNACALQQIVLNLVMNAIRHTPAKGTLMVSIGLSAAERCEVVFQDSGEGIPQEALEKVLEAGFSGSGHTSGRGLAVCRQIMNEHGGSIHVDNGPLGGARIRLSFPGCEAVAR